MEQVDDVYIRTVWSMEFYVSGALSQSGGNEAHVHRSPTSSREAGEVRVLYYRRTKATSKAPTGYLIHCGTDVFAGSSMLWLHVRPRTIDEGELDPELKSAAEQKAEEEKKQ